MSLTTLNDPAGMEGPVSEKMAPFPVEARRMLCYIPEISYRHVFLDKASTAMVPELYGSVKTWKVQSHTVI